MPSTDKPLTRGHRMHCLCEVCKRKQTKINRAIHAAHKPTKEEPMPPTKPEKPQHTPGTTKELYAAIQTASSALRALAADAGRSEGWRDAYTQAFVCLEANVQPICTAVNSHAALVEALSAAVKCLEFGATPQPVKEQIVAECRAVLAQVQKD